MKTLHAFYLLLILVGYAPTSFSQSWTKIYEESNSLSIIQFADENTLYVLNSDMSNEILKSTDKGETWELMQTFDLGFYAITAFRCKNSDTLILETTYLSPFSFDGMNTLDTIPLPSMEFYYSEFNWVGNKLFLSCVNNDTTRLLVKETFADEWEVLQVFIREPFEPYLPNLLQTYLDEGNAYFFTHYTNDRIYKTTDGGNTLTEHVLSGVSIPLHLTKMIHHPGHPYIYIPDSYGASLRISTETWNVNYMIDAVLDSLQIIDIEFYEDKVWALLTDGKLINSTDNGENWIVDTTFEFAKDMSINEAGDILVTNANAIFMKSGIPSSNEVHATTLEFGIYPNPSKDYFTIQIADHTQIQSIYIFNSLGQKIYEGRNAQIHCENWAAGVYYVVIKDKENRNGINKFTKE